MALALIAEDEPLLAAEITEELGRAWPELKVCEVAYDGHAAWRAFEHHAPDVVFADVQMPGLDGLELARLIGDRAHVVFVTAFNHFAVQAFEAGAVDYLVKPLDAARLALAIQRLKQRIGQQPANLSGLWSRLPPGAAGASSRGLRWLTVPQGRDLRLITSDEICYLKADHKYVAVVTTDSEALLSTPLKELHARLDPEVFWQVHRGTVVNIQAVRSIHRGLGGRLSLSLRQRPEILAVGPGYAHLFRQW
jgi:DNA-binding LytR/AlgR family response regulator